MYISLDLHFNYFKHAKRAVRFFHLNYKIKYSILILFLRLKNEAPPKEQERVTEVNFVLFYNLKV